MLRMDTLLVSPSEALETFEASDIETVYSMAAGARKSFTRGPGGVAFRHIVTLANKSVHASPLLNHDAMLAVDRALTERVIEPRVKAALAEIEAGHEVRFRCFKERDARKRKTTLYTVVLTLKGIRHEDKRGSALIEWRDLDRLGAMSSGTRSGHGDSSRRISRTGAPRRQPVRLS